MINKNKRIEDSQSDQSRLEIIFHRVEKFEYRRFFFVFSWDDRQKRENKRKTSVGNKKILVLLAYVLFRFLLLK